MHSRATGHIGGSVAARVVDDDYRERAVVALLQQGRDARADVRRLIARRNDGYDFGPVEIVGNRRIIVARLCTPEAAA